MILAYINIGLLPGVNNSRDTVVSFENGHVPSAGTLVCVDLRGQVMKHMVHFGVIDEILNSLGSLRKIVSRGSRFFTDVFARRTNRMFGKKNKVFRNVA